MEGMAPVSGKEVSSGGGAPVRRRAAGLTSSTVMVGSDTRRRRRTADAGVALAMASDGKTTMSSLELGFHSDFFFQICFQIKLNFLN